MVQPAPAPPSGAPGLTQVLTAEERNRLGASVESRLASARRLLAPIREAALTADQAETLRAVRSFMNRAENVKQSDPLLAAQLAYRAEVLASSLAMSLE